MRTAHYSDFLNSLAGLIGIDLAGLGASELTMINTYFNRALRKIWEMNNWLDVSPYGEARFPNNTVSFPNDYTASGWASTGLTVVKNSLQNPFDYRVNCQRLLETVTTGVHRISKSSVALTPSNVYQLSVYILPAGRTSVFIDVSDGGDLSAGVTFSLTATPKATPDDPTTTTAAVAQITNGFFACSITFTASDTAGALASGSIGIFLENGAGSTSYTGVPDVGIYCYGLTCSLIQAGGPGTLYIPYNQDGELGIDAVFDCWSSSPVGFLPGYRSGYQLTNYGIQLIGATCASPVYVFYRQQRPLFSGAAYSGATSYAVGAEVYFTNSAGDSDYYTCVIAAAAGQSPATNPTFWSIASIPYIFFPYCVYNAFGDWLVMDGQAEKAAGMYAYAQSCIDDEADKQERQQGCVLPLKVQTHVTSQNRGLGLVGQSNQPGFLNGQGYGY